jgi:hypothetical protein
MWACEMITEKLELENGLLEGVSLWKNLMENVGLWIEKLELVKIKILEGVSLWKGFVENVGLWIDYWKACLCVWRTSGGCEPVKGSYGRNELVK